MLPCHICYIYRTWKSISAGGGGGGGGIFLGGGGGGGMATPPQINIKSLRDLLSQAMGVPQKFTYFSPQDSFSMFHIMNFSWGSVFFC